MFDCGILSLPRFLEVTTMVYATENLNLSTLSNSKTVVALEFTLNQSLCNLKDLVLEFEQLQIEVTAQKEKCERKACVGSEALKKVIDIKDNIIQSVASALTTLNETKDMNIIHEAFKILCGETGPPISPNEKFESKMITPKKETFSEIADALKNESLSEIEGTPTGRTSPVIMSKKYRNATASDAREKKKCPDNWPISENKTIKLTYPTPVKKKSGSKLRQARFTFVKQKSVVDLTSSPEFSGGIKGFQDNLNCLQMDIKKESFDDEDTIQPSPTSTTTNFPELYRSALTNTPLKRIEKNSPKKISKNSPSKFIKKQLQLSKLQIKTENTSKCDENLDFKANDENATNMEESINLLRPVNRYQAPSKPFQGIDPEETDCEIDASLSLLRPVIRQDKVSPENKAVLHSPSKAPLSENINCTNLQTQCDTVSSMSLLAQNAEVNDPDLVAKVKENQIRFEPVFKEPTVRKKAEKRALPGWSCDECKNFYAELYKDNPEMLAKKMDDCSKHRGRNNPIRPKTPPGFWYPRWDVPEDTEEFNRRNNAV